MDIENATQILRKKVSLMERSLRVAAPRHTDILDGVDAGDQSPRAVTNRVNMVCPESADPDARYERVSAFAKYIKKNPGELCQYVKAVMASPADNVIDLFR